MQQIFFHDHRDYLRTELARRSGKNPRYSLRAFARDLGISVSSLSEVLKGAYGLERSRALAIAEVLQLDEENKRHFADLNEAKFHKSPGRRQAAQLRIDQRYTNTTSTVSLDAFQVISEWYHMAILEFVGLSEFQHEEKQIAKRLGLPLVVVNEAVARLERLGLLIRTKNGKFQATDDFSQVGNQSPSQAIRNFHTQILEKAGQALHFQGVQEREFSSTIFSIDKDRMSEAKAELKKMRLEFANKYTSGAKKNDVYCLSMQFFSLLEREIEQ